MSTDVQVDSSSALTEAADLFYKSEPQPHAESAPATETHSAPASKEVSETAPASDSGKTTSEESESPNGNEPKPQRTNAEQRIKQLLAENKQLKAERQTPRQEAPKTETPKVEAPKVETAPDPGQFNTWAEYQKADADFRQKQITQQVKDAIERDRTEQSRLRQEQDQRETFAKQQKAVMDRVTEATKRHADFHEKVFSEDGSLALQLHPVIDQFIPNSKAGMEILYHLASQPEEAQRLLTLDPYDALREAIALEAKLTEGLTNPPQPKTKLKPPSTVSGKGGQPKPMSAEEVLYGAD